MPNKKIGGLSAKIGRTGLTDILNSHFKKPISEGIVEVSRPADILNLIPKKENETWPKRSEEQD